MDLLLSHLGRVDSHPEGLRCYGGTLAPRLLSDGKSLGK